MDGTGLACEIRTCLNSSRLQSVLIYLQFVSAAARSFANLIVIPACTTGGQHGVIAQDRRLRQAVAQEGMPSSRRSLPFMNAQTLIILSYGIKIEIWVNKANHRLIGKFGLT